MKIVSARGLYFYDEYLSLYRDYDVDLFGS